jgi:hypothetical protein
MNKNQTGDSVYLFLGSNATISPTPNSTSVNSSIDLSNLPTIFNPNFFTGPFAPVSSLRAPLATLLICSPKLEFLSRKVLLRPTANRTDPDATIESNLDVPSPLNLHQQATRNLFSILLNATVMSTDSFLTPDKNSVNYNSVSSAMLLNGTDDENRASISPFDLATINQNVDEYTLSALKAFIKGYRGRAPGIRSQQDVFIQNVSGIFTSRNLTLRTSLPFAIVHTTLFGILGIMLAGFVYSERAPRPS